MMILRKLHGTECHLQRIVALNDEGTLRVTHAVLQRSNPDARFCIVVVSSLAALFPMPLKATYAASKRFLMDFGDRKSTRLNSSHSGESRMPSSA